MRIFKIASELAKLGNDDLKDKISAWFAEVDKLNLGVGKTNTNTMWLLIGIYALINVFHLFNIFALGTKPMTYIWFCWIQHLTLGAFWFLTSKTFKSKNLYIEDVKKLNENYKREGVQVTLHDKKNIITFSLTDSLK